MEETRMSDEEKALLDFVLKFEGHVKAGLHESVAKWQAEAARNRDEWLRGNADAAYRAELDARPAMSHERYRVNAEACDGHATRFAAVAVGLDRLIGRLEESR
jgi:hypothetical protein